MGLLNSRKNQGLEWTVTTFARRFFVNRWDLFLYDVTSMAFITILTRFLFFWLVSFKSFRLECLKLIQNGLADFAPFEPEDAYISAKFMDDSLAVFLEMRNALTQLGNSYCQVPSDRHHVIFNCLDLFRYLSVAVVRNDANINYPADLRGKVSCHTGWELNPMTFVFFFLELINIMIVKLVTGELLAGIWLFQG